MRRSEGVRYRIAHWKCLPSVKSRRCENRGVDRAMDDGRDSALNLSEQVFIEGRQTERTCIPVRTHIIKAGDDILEVLDEYVKPLLLQEGDVVVISSKVVAISQDHLYCKSDIRVSLLANLLARFVTDSPYGVGLRNPRTMQVAINLVGAWRILLAALIAAVTKPLGLSGYFYRVAGQDVAMIDGISDHHFEQLQDYIVLPPRQPESTARKISQHLGVPAVIADVNDLGGSVVVGMYGDGELDSKEIEELLRYDNPLGQTRRQTPVGILRRVSREDKD